MAARSVIAQTEEELPDIRIVAGSGKTTTRQTDRPSRTTIFRGENQGGVEALVNQRAFRQIGKYQFGGKSKEAANNTNKPFAYRNQLAAQNANSIVRNRANRLVKQQFVENYQEDASKVARILNLISKKTKALSNAFKTASGLVRSAEIAPFVGLLYIPQFLFALLFISTVYVEQEWRFVSWAIPGEILMVLAWIGIICTGTLSMFIAAFAYNRLLLKSTLIVTGLICFAAYWVPYIFIVPWVFLWMLIINMTNIMDTVESIKE